MNSAERNEYIEKICNQRNFNLETQEHIKTYIYLNERLFGKFLNIDRICERVLDNLHHNIGSYKIDLLKKYPIQAAFAMIAMDGAWIKKEHFVFVNPIFCPKRLKGIRLSTILHELDHCATANDFEIDKSGINNKHRKSKILNITGIWDKRQEEINGVSLYGLNEGITAYKQEMYDREIGVKHRTGYTYEKNAAKFIGDIIGKEELIKMHLNNDYEGIKSAYYKRTGNDLNELVEMINHKPKRNAFLRYIPIVRKVEGMIYKRKNKEYSKKMDSYIENIKMNTSRKRKTDFIPKCDVSEQVTLARINSNNRDVVEEKINTINQESR